MMLIGVRIVFAHCTHLETERLSTHLFFSVTANNLDKRKYIV